MERSCIERSVGQYCFCICALRCLAVQPCICSHSIIVFGCLVKFPPHLSLFIYIITNNCPNLVQGCDSPSPRRSYALDKINSKSPVCVSSLKLILSFHIFATECYKCPLQKLKSNMPPDLLCHQDFLFSSLIFYFLVFVCFVFPLPSLL